MTKLIYQEEAQKQHDEVQKKIESSILNKKNFVVKAGAGAGKTKSLVDTLIFLKDKYKKEYMANKKRIAVITYTNDAADEIIERVGKDDFFAISTIHSFAWDILKAFKRDLIEYVRKSKKINSINDVRYDTKNSTNEIYYLKHHEVLDLFHDFSEADLFKDLLVEQYPIILIDEYQDTQRKVINAFLDLSRYSNSITLGLFGDPMQRIYASGDSQLEKKLEEKRFRQINKAWNWRSSEEIVTFINRVRALQTDPNKEVDEHIPLDFEQKSVRGGNDKKPTIEIIADNTENNNIDPEYKVLILEHRMVAKERSFLNLFDLFNQRKYRDSLIEGSITELQSFKEPTMELYESINEEHKSNKIMHYIKKYNELFMEKNDSWEDIKEKLDELSSIYNKALDLVKNKKTTTIKEYYEYVLDKKLFYIDKKIDFEDEPWKQLEDIRLIEYIEYQKYIDESPFSTKHSSKGLEYKNVCVVINQSEARGTLLNFNQLFRINRPTDRVRENHKKGKDTTLTRTKKLFYVAVSRAMEELKIQLYVPSARIEETKEQMESLFGDVAEIKVIK